MKTAAISFKIALQVFGLLTAGLFLTSAVFAQDGTATDISPGLELLAEKLECGTRIECEAKFNADPARGIDLATELNVYSEEDLEKAQILKARVFSALENVDPAIIHEELIKIAESLIADNPDLARRLDVESGNVTAARTIVEGVKEAGVNLDVCSRSAELLSRGELIACLNASKNLAGQRDVIGVYVSGERIDIVESDDFEASLQLQEALNRGEYGELGVSTPDEIGRKCLQKGSDPICDEIAARFFGPEGTAELARARAQVSTVEAQYRKGAEGFTLLTSSGRKIAGKNNIREACEEAFRTRNIELARACGDFAVKNGLATAKQVSEGIGFLESVEVANVDLDSCRKNPDACKEFIREDRRGDFGIMREINEIMTAEIGFDPSRCEEGGFNQEIGRQCLEGAKRTLPRIRALATTPEAQRIVREIEEHIAEGDRFREREGGFDEIFRAEGGPGGCQSSFECYSYCSDSDHGAECVAWGAQQGVFEGDEAIRRFEEYNTLISSPATIRFQDNTGPQPYPPGGDPNRPGQVPLFPESRSGNIYSSPPATGPYYPGPGQTGPSPECFEAIRLGDFARAKDVCTVSQPYQPGPYPGPYPDPYRPDIGNREELIDECLRSTGESRQQCERKVDNYLGSGTQSDPKFRCNYEYQDEASCNANPSCSWQGDRCGSNFCPRTFAPPPSCYAIDPPPDHDGRGYGPRGCQVCTTNYQKPPPPEKTTCPAFPSVSQCGPNENKVTVFKSEACGVYYGCEPKNATPPTGANFPYTFSNGVVAKSFQEAEDYCYASGPGTGRGVAAECETRFGIYYPVVDPPFPPGEGNWVNHTWQFSDGSTQSSILDRTDAEYLEYVRSVEAQCRTIPQSRFTWRPNAGDDSPSNWQNFGIPDCSGSGPPVYGDCRNNSSKSACFGQPGCNWFRNPDGYEYCEGNNFVPPTPECSNYFQRSLCEDDSFCQWQLPPLGGIGWCQVKSYTPPTTDGCSDKGSGWHEEYRESGELVCFNENHDQYTVGSGSARSCVITTRFGCYNSGPVTPVDPNFCPSFSFSKWDQSGNHYCQLNSERSCTYIFKDDQRNYQPENCPPEAPVYGDCRANSDQNSCYNQPGCLWVASINSCEGDDYVLPPTSSTWVNHTWYFNDGSSVFSSILSRTDGEYTNYIAEVEAKCRTISQSGFSWKSNAGDDRPDNWRNFGIPNCESGYVPPPGTTPPPGTGGMQNCFYPNATRNGSPVGTVWCEADYYNCHFDSPTGTVATLDNLSLGAPSSCESGSPDDGTGTPPYYPPPGTENCFDNVDNDGDGLIDFADPECSSGGGDAPQEVKNILPGAHEHWSTADTKTYLGSDEDSFVVYNYGTASITRQGKCSTDPSPPDGCSGGGSGGPYYPPSGDACGGFTSVLPGSHSHGYTSSGSEICFGGDEWSYVYSSDSTSAASIKNCTDNPVSECSSVGPGTGSGGGSSSQCPSGYHFEYYEGSNVVCFTDGASHDTYTIDSGSPISCETAYKSGCSGSSGGTGGYCGNYVCDSNETSSSCPSDCGGDGTGSAGYCGNYVCDPGETPSSCPSDCSSGSGQCPAGQHFEQYRSDGAVVCFLDGGNHDFYTVNGGPSVSCSTTYEMGCPGGSSTGGSGGYCGDNICNNAETTSSCPADCGSASGETCGNNYCGSGETATSCPADCSGGTTTETCGNNFCGAGETVSSCPSDCGSTGGGSCPTYGFGSPDGSYACNYGTCPNGCNFDSQGCPVSCYASSGGTAPSGGDPQTECTNYGGTWDAANNYCQMPGSPPSTGDPAADCASYGGTWDSATNFCNMPPQASFRNQNLLGQVNIVLIEFGRFIGSLFGR